MNDNNNSVDNNYIDKNVKIYKDVSIKSSCINNGVEIGDYSIIRRSNLDERVEIGRRNTLDTVSIGKCTYTGEFFMGKYCIIGKYCAIAWNVTIGGANHELHNLAITPAHKIFSNDSSGIPYYKSYEKKVIVGNDVWVGAGAHILRGVNVGDGAVIGANSVVTRDIEPYSIVAGVPARTIGKRFDDKTIIRLLKIKWWDFSTEKINKAKPLFGKNVDDHLLCELEQIADLEN